MTRMFKRPWPNAGPVIAIDPATNKPVTNASINFFMIAYLQKVSTQANGLLRTYLTALP